MSWYDVLGLSGLCTQDQVEKAFMEKAKPYKDQSWDSMHFEEKKRVQELLDAFEVLGAGKSAQLLYQQFLCSKTIHGTHQWTRQTRTSPPSMRPTRKTRQ